MSLSTRERARKYLDRNPDATTSELAGALMIPPDEAGELADDLAPVESESPEDRERSVSVPAHYERVADVYETLGTLDGMLTLGNADYTKWYKNKRGGRADDLPPGADGRARPFVMASADYGRLIERMDRTLYAAANYTNRSYYSDSWKAYRWGSDKREWWVPESGEWEENASPTPGYGDIGAYAPVVDVDLIDELKHARPDGGVPRDVIEAALSAWIAAFAELAGGRDAVHALDSVGGAYIMLAPSTTRPIAEEFTGEDRAKVYDELTDRLNEWVEEIGNRVRWIPGVADVFEPDLVNHKNRLYKAPMSVHASLDGVVTPIDTDAPSFDYTPLADVDAAEIDRARAWADSFTDDYSESIQWIVGTLWPEYTVKTDSWRDALEQWLEDDRTDRDAAGSSTLADVDATGTDSGSGTASSADVAPKEDVYRAIDRLDGQRVAADTIVAEWNDGAHTSGGARAFYPTWDPACNGTANIIGDNGAWVDTGEGDKGGPVKMALMNADGYRRWHNETPKGREWLRGIVELRDLGYDVPLPVSGRDDDFDGSAYYDAPLEAIALEQLGSADDLHDTPTKLLKACLHARDTYECGLELEQEDPPYKALVGVAKTADLTMADPEDGILGKQTHQLARAVFDDMSVDDV